MNCKSKTLAVAAMLAVTVLPAMAGAKPSIMVMPDEAWCNTNGYMIEVEDDGVLKTIPDLNAAYLNNELKALETQLAGLFQDNGLEIKSYAESQGIDSNAENEMEKVFESKSGRRTSINDYDRLMQSLNPDFVVRVGWTVERSGFENVVNFRAEARDSYTGKIIGSATAAPTGKYTQSVSSLLTNAITQQMGTLSRRMNEYFTDIQNNGREITLQLNVLDDSSADMDTEFEEKTLAEIITDWVDENTSNHTYNQRSASTNYMSFDQVRIPFLDSRGKRLQARQFVDQLRRYLRKTYNVESKNATKGLGTGRLVIGEK